MLRNNVVVCVLYVSTLIASTLVPASSGFIMPSPLGRSLTTTTSTISLKPCRKLKDAPLPSSKLYHHNHVVNNLIDNYVVDASTSTSTSLLSSSLWISVVDDDFSSSSAVSSISPIILTVVALTLGIAAQTFINSMLKGDQGLGAFLKDGSGYQNSAYRPTGNKDSSSSSNPEDPLPWLSLPKLDFVEVAGQQQVEAEKMVQLKLESLREEMNKNLQEGNMEEATKLRNELEQLCEQSGFEFQKLD